MATARRHHVVARGGLINCPWCGNVLMPDVMGISQGLTEQRNETRGRKLWSQAAFFWKLLKLKLRAFT